MCAKGLLHVVAAAYSWVIRRRVFYLQIWCDFVVLQASWPVLFFPRPLVLCLVRVLRTVEGCAPTNNGNGNIGVVVAWDQANFVMTKHAVAVSSAGATHPAINLRETTGSFVIRLQEIYHPFTAEHRHMPAQCMLCTRPGNATPLPRFLYTTFEYLADYSIV